MKHNKLKFFVGIVLLLGAVVTSCTGGKDEVAANHEVVVRFDVSQVILEQASDPENEGFLEVYHAAIQSRNKTNGNFVEVFFKMSDSLFARRNYIEYFKVNIKLANDDSNKGVKKYFLNKRKERAKPFLTALRSRLEQFGVVSAELIDGQDQVEVGIIEDAEEIYMARLIMSNAKVEFLEVYETDAMYGLWNELKQLGQSKERLVSSTDESGLELSVFRYVQNNEGQFRVEPQHKNTIDVFLNTAEAKDLLPKSVRFKWSKDQAKDSFDNLDGYILHPCKFPKNGKAKVDQDDIKRALVGSNSETGEHTVNIEMTPDGDVKWRGLTAENIERVIAICVNDVVISAPTVRCAIIGGRTEISGSFTKSEAQDLARILSVGNLPLPCAFISIKKL